MEKDTLIECALHSLVSSFSTSCHSGFIGLRVTCSRRALPAPISFQSNNCYDPMDAEDVRMGTKKIEKMPITCDSEI